MGFRTARYSIDNGEIIAPPRRLWSSAVGLMLVIAVLASPGDSVFAQQSRRSLKKDQILELLNNFVPSARIAELVDSDGIDFDPDEGYLRSLESAGAERVLIDALRARGAQSKVKQLVERGKNALDQGQYLQAEEAFISALSLQADNFDAHFGLADVLLHEKGNAEKGLDHAREALRLKPDNAAAQGLFGDAMGHTGSFDDAIAEIRKALARDPGNREARVNLAWALLGKGEIDAGIAEAREALRLDPDHPNPHRVLASGLNRKGDTEGALAEIRLAMKLKPVRFLNPSRMSLGTWLRGKGDIEGAISEFRRVIISDSHNSAAHTQLGVCLAEKGDLEGAMAEYREAIRLRPDSVAAHHSMGKALEKKGDLEGALKEYRIAYQTSPKNAVIRGDYERLLKQPKP